MDFLKEFEKDLEKSGIQQGASKPPRYWYSTGNYVLNKIISGSFLKGIPQGRIVCYTGPSRSGKSFLAANAIREAQKEGAYIVVLDSENALDDDFVSKIGVKPGNDYTYIPVDTIPQCKKSVSSFIKGYSNEYGDDPEAPKVLIVIDSLDMLMTETEQEHFQKGVSKGDQGQRNKQLKAMLREFVQAIKRPNISMIVTAQVYKNQDAFTTDGPWVVADAIQFSLSQIVLVTKLGKLKDDKTYAIEGIKMRCEGYKTRFAKPFQTVTIEVPYETGMDQYNGILDVAVGMGVVERVHTRFKVSGETDTWYKKDFGKKAQKVLEMCENKTQVFLSAKDEEPEPEDEDDKRSSKRKRQDKASSQ